MGSHTGQFWSFWGAAYPVTAAVRRRHLPNPVAINDNKENVPAPRCRARRRKSPLPYWYPRTPLRDITVIVNVLERRRRMRARAARAQQVNPDPEVSPIANLVTDDSNGNDPSPSPASVSVSPLSSSSSNSSVEDKKQSEYEKKLEKSIDRIETLVMKNLKSSSKPAPTKSMRTLMLMR